MSRFVNPGHLTQDGRENGAENGCCRGFASFDKENPEGNLTQSEGPHENYFFYSIEERSPVYGYGNSTRMLGTDRRSGTNLSVTTHHIGSAISYGRNRRFAPAPYRAVVVAFTGGYGGG